MIGLVQERNCMCKNPIVTNTKNRNRYHPKDRAPRAKPTAVVPVPASTTIFIACFLPNKWFCDKYFINRITPGRIRKNWLRTLLKESDMHMKV